MTHPALKLLPRHTGRELTSWRVGHIDAVTSYLAGNLTGREHAILALGDGISTYIVEGPIDWPSPFETEHFADAIDAFAEMLNQDLGRLDAGTLSRWADRMYEAIGWDSANGALA